MRQNTYREFTDCPPLSYKNLQGRNKMRQGSEALDDVISGARGLRALADEIEKAARETDERRRSGKAWDSGAVMKKLDQTDTQLRKLYADTEKLLEAQRR